MKASSVILTLFLASLLSLFSNGLAETKDDDVALYNSYIDQEYYFKLWDKIGKEQQKILKKKFRKRKKSQKATTDSDAKYWKELATSERKLVHYFQEFYRQGQNNNNHTDTKTAEFLSKLEKDPKLAEDWKLAPDELNQVTKDNVREIYGNIKTRRSTLEQNEEALEGIFDRGVKSFNDETKDLLQTREARLNASLPDGTRGLSDKEKRVIAEHIETYPDTQALFTIGCLEERKDYKDCAADYKKHEEYIQKNIKGKMKEGEVATSLLREFKRSEMELIKEVDAEIKKISSPEGTDSSESENSEANGTIHPVDEVIEDDDEDMFAGIELDFSPEEYEIPMLEGKRGDRFFLSTDKKCGGVSEGVEMGHIFTASILEESLKEEGQEEYQVGRDIVPFFNCIKHRNILTTLKPSVECTKGSEHVIGYFASLNLVKKEVALKNTTEVRNDYVQDDLFFTINRYLNTENFHRYYAHEIPIKAPTKMREIYRGMIKKLGFDREEGPLLILYKKKERPHLAPIYRCRFKLLKVKAK